MNEEDRGERDVNQKLKELKNEFAEVSDPNCPVKDYDRAIALREQIKQLEQTAKKQKKAAIDRRKIEEEVELRQASSKLKKDMVEMWEGEDRERQEHCTKELQRLEYTHVLAAQRLEKNIEVASHSAQAKMKPSAKLISLQNKESTLAKSQLFEEAKEVHLQAEALLEKELQEYRERIETIGKRKRQKMKEEQAQELKVLRYRLLNHKEESKQKRVQQARNAQGRIQISKVKLSRNHKRNIVEKTEEEVFVPEPEPTPVLQNIYAVSQTQPQAPTDLSSLIDFDEPAPEGTLIVHSASEIPVATTKYNQPVRKRPGRRNSRSQSQSARSNLEAQRNTDTNAAAASSTYLRESKPTSISTAPPAMTDAELELQRQFDAMLTSDSAVGDIEKKSLNDGAKEVVQERYAAASAPAEPKEERLKSRTVNPRTKGKKTDSTMRKMNNTYAGLMEEKNLPAQRRGRGRGA